MEQICILSFLGMNSYQDIRRRQISLKSAALYGIMGILYVYLNRQQLVLLMMGAVPGLLLMCLGKASGGAMGLGDGLIAMVSGIYMGFWRILEFITLALMLAAVWAGFLMVVRKKGRKSEFPFVPFMLAAYVMLCLV